MCVAAAGPSTVPDQAAATVAEIVATDVLVSAKNGATIGVKFIFLRLLVITRDVYDLDAQNKYKA